MNKYQLIRYIRFALMILGIMVIVSIEKKLPVPGISYWAILYLTALGSFFIPFLICASFIVDLTLLYPLGSSLVLMSMICLLYKHLGHRRWFFLIVILCVTMIPEVFEYIFQGDRNIEVTRFFISLLAIIPVWMRLSKKQTVHYIS